MKCAGNNFNPPNGGAPRTHESNSTISRAQLEREVMKNHAF